MLQSCFEELSLETWRVLGFSGFSVFFAALSVSNIGCGNPDPGPGTVAGSGVSSQAGMQSVADPPPRSDSSNPASAPQAGHSAMDFADNSAGMGSASPSMPVAGSQAPGGSMPSASPGSAMDAGQPERDAGSRPVVDNLSDKVLAMWGSS